ncbi:hypothetical protein H671_2g7892 [Cricetulus griseus]|nr:hypothetical protein H671_2g7892 [Cricetulus griseus]
MLMTINRLDSQFILAFFPTLSVSAFVFVVNLFIGAEEMAQWLKALVTHPDDPGSVPSTHMEAHNRPYLQPQVIIQCPLFASSDSRHA